MWKKEHREREAKQARKIKRYPSDMTDIEWAAVQPCPSAGVIDSQAVKAPSADKRGYDAAKKIVGRKRHIAVDTDGRLLMVNLTPADIADSRGGGAGGAGSGEEALAGRETLVRRWRI
ncbi:hypothetical protein MAFF211271_21400 [Ralstonia syzygii subsp. indonesiensis]|nr:hypothetical protein MAFF211271_21400 [Ralstonia pseudosolanacearum]